MFHARREKSRLKFYSFFSDSVMRLLVAWLRERRKRIKTIATMLSKSALPAARRRALLIPELSTGETVMAPGGAGGALACGGGTLGGVGWTDEIAG
jgi:hypothetical protein